jgi:glycine/serine hydroxymethyltransferase
MSEYERLKKQRDEIIQRQARAMAEKIADDIMSDGAGTKAHRIVMVDSNNRMGAGWSRGQLVDRIAAHLSNNRIREDKLKEGGE